MEDWQERVIQEREELHMKIYLLREFINKAMSNPDKPMGLHLLKRQLEAMDQYESILNERINEFNL